ncbi:MAG TPA: plasmid stabilization protein [Blastocatellia bacterium]|nr:plasmid stabilization protein [Blastocatellia bacterium]
MNYSFHPHVEKELEDAENYYDGIREELGDRFRAEIEMALSRILKFPNAWQLLTKTVRRRRLIDFPYGIVYRVKTDEIRILAVMHLHREPSYWAYRQ